MIVLTILLTLNIVAGANFNLFNCNYTCMNDECANKQTFCYDVHHSLVNSPELVDPHAPELYSKLYELYSLSNDPCDAVVTSFLSNYFYSIYKAKCEQRPNDAHRKILTELINNDNTYLHELYEQCCPNNTTATLIPNHTTTPN